MPVQTWRWGKLLVLAALVLILALILAPSMEFCLAQSGTPESTIPPDRMQNSYAIYSLLIPSEFLARLDSSQNPRWAIAAITVNAQDVSPPLSPDAALKPPQKHAKEFLEAIADYNLRKNQRFLLTRDFQLDRPYVLLSPPELAEFRAARTAPHVSSSSQQKYSGYPGITYLSEVYFDSDQTAALVYMLDWCGNLCAQMEWIYLEKRDGRWVRRSGQTKS